VKPLKLTMTAFGPYKNKEVIDFSELKENNLFAISGNTGAGKTTIFDGICFALYGSASGSDRDDNRMLRSDFADDDTHTSVELEFTLHGKSYRILRQLGHVKQGNKTKTGEKYEFFEIRGDREIPCVDRQIVSEIDKKVEEMIGLTQDQFKQIVMLPQGEFRKLLTSKTENKEAILRRLFKTENYKQLNELLKQRRDKAQKEFDQKDQEVKLYIERIPKALPLREDSELSNILEAEHHNPQQVVSALEEERKFYDKQVEADQQKYNKAYEEHSKKSTVFHQAKILNDRFRELEQKESQLKEKMEQIPQYKKKEEQLEQAERAASLEVYDKQAEEWRKEEKNITAALDAAAAAEKTAKIQLEKAQQNYQKEEKRQKERQEVSRELDRLNDYLPSVKEIESKKRQLTDQKKQVKETHSKLENIKADLQQKQKAAEDQNKKIQKADRKVGDLPDKQMQLNRMRDRVKLLQDFLKLQQNSVVLKQTLNENKTAFQEIKEIYEKKENEWMANQASILASHLHDGEACPVCGSRDHPHKAIHHEEGITKEALDKLKKQYDEKNTVYQRAQVRLENNSNDLIEKEEELKTNNISTQDVKVQYDQLVQEGKRLSKEVETLEKLREELKQQKDLYEKASQEIKVLEKKKENLESDYQQQNTAYETQKAVYGERLRTIPEQLRDLTMLEKQIIETNNKKAILEKAWEEAQHAFQREKENYTKEVSNVENKQHQLTEAKGKRANADLKFKEACTKKGFVSEEEYRNAKMNEEERKKWKDEINQFNQQLSTLQQQAEELKQALKDKQRVDLTILQEELDELKQRYELELQKLNLSKERLNSTIELRANILEANEEAMELERKLASVTDLYDVMRGQNNQKISFERYLQIEYLEQIIEAANGRLIRLSNGQFRLERSDRQESHGRQSGLGLDIYDSYTGQTRDVKTLSGGEKFNASLSLALGMSDVIQSFQGNISIETMFIDEGFGSLDEESLTKAIDTLIDLQQSGRMIGVISHVQELKNMLPARLEVVKQKEGHSRTKFVVM